MRLISIFLLATGLALGAVSGATRAAPAQWSGLMENHGPNVSQSPGYSVYFTDVAAGKLVQTLDSQGSLLFTALISGSSVTVLPIGTLSSQVHGPGYDGSVAGSSGPTAAEGYQCPCHAQVIYNGPNGTNVAIFDSSGKIVRVIDLPPGKPQ